MIPPMTYNDGSLHISRNKSDARSHPDGDTVSPEETVRNKSDARSHPDGDTVSPEETVSDFMRIGKFSGNPRTGMCMLLIVSDM